MGLLAVGVWLELNAFACFVNFIPHTGLPCPVLTEGVVFSLSETYYFVYFFWGGAVFQRRPALF